MLIALIIIGILTRLIPHVPNFSPLVGIALLSGAYIRRKNGFLIPLGIYILSDLFIGMHDVALFTWSSIILIYFLGKFIQKQKTVSRLCTVTIASSLLFFVWTNFGVWALGWYPPTISGLIQCYTLALPFLRTSLMADFIYVGALFGIYELLLQRTHVVPKENATV